MPSFVLLDPKLYIAQFDLSGDMSEMALSLEVDLLDDTVFGATTRSRKMGLASASAVHQGLWEGGDDLVEDALWNNQGKAPKLCSYTAEGGDEGDVAYSMIAAQAHYNPGGVIGEMYSFEAAFESAGNILRGTLLKSAKDQETATGNGTSRQLGTVATGKTIISSLHCTQFDGTTLDVTLDSDSDPGMAASPETQITHAQLSAVGSEQLSKAGEILDDWWRLDFVFVGTSFRLVVNVSIQ